MAVYRILVRKRVQTYEWSNSYTVVSNHPYARTELFAVADHIAPRLAAFEQHFHLRAVQFYDTLTTPLLATPIPNEFAQRFINGSGQRDIPVEQSWGALVTLLVGLQPVSNHWGRKDFQYSVGRTDVVSQWHGYVLRPEVQQSLQAALSVAKTQLAPLLQARPDTICLAISTSENEHEPMSYNRRYIQDVIIKGVHWHKPRRR